MPDEDQFEDQEIPGLLDIPDNNPNDQASYIEPDSQDSEGTERPEVDKHPEEG